MTSPDFLSGMVDKTKPLVSLMVEIMQGISQPMRAQMLLVINHVVAQEPEATKRLKVYAGRKVALQHAFGLWILTITPAGLFEDTFQSVSENNTSEMQDIDLRIKIKASDVMMLINLLLKGERPPVEIEGDADLAAAFAWLGENLRWDYEEDLSRIIGDEPAHIAVERLQAVVGLFKGILESIGRQMNSSGK